MTMRIDQINFFIFRNFFEQKLIEHNWSPQDRKEIDKDINKITLTYYQELDKNLDILHISSVRLFNHFKGVL